MLMQHQQTTAEKNNRAELIKVFQKNDHHDKQNL